MERLFKKRILSFTDNNSNSAVGRTHNSFYTNAIWSKVKPTLLNKRHQPSYIISGNQRKCTSCDLRLTSSHKIRPSIRGSLYVRKSVGSIIINDTSFLTKNQRPEGARMGNQKPKNHPYLIKPAGTASLCTMTLIAFSRI